MDGRRLFDRYRKLFDFLQIGMKLFPKKICWRLLEFCRNTNGRKGFLIRFLLVGRLAKKIGYNVAIFPGVYFENLEKLVIGNNVSIHQMCYIDAEGGIDIGDEVSIAHRTSILSSNHKFGDKDIPIKYQGMSLSGVKIQNNVWVGCGVTILAGVTVGSGSVIGAGAVVTKDIPTDTISCGIPAKVLKLRIKSEL